MKQLLNSNVAMIVVGLVCMFLLKGVPLIGWLIWIVGLVFFIIGAYPYALALYDRFIKKYIDKLLGR